MSGEPTANRPPVLAKLREGLQHVPQAVIDETATSITVQPASPDGYAVSLEIGGGDCVVSLEGWHEHFAEADEAIAFFGLALSVDARLAITYRGETPVAWTFEVLEGEHWRAVGTTSLKFTPFWRKKHVVHRRNALVGASDSAASP
jgi:hypothetical protein